MLSEVKSQLSAPSKAAISTPKRGSWYHSLLCGFRRGGEEGSIFSCLLFLFLFLFLFCFFFAKWVNTSCTTHRFCFICYINNPTTDLHRECWFGFTQLWTSAFKQFILSYPILSYIECSRQSTAPPPISHLLPKR